MTWPRPARTTRPAPSSTTVTPPRSTGRSSTRPSMSSPLLPTRPGAGSWSFTARAARRSSRPSTCHQVTRPPTTWKSTLTLSGPSGPAGRDPSRCRWAGTSPPATAGSPEEPGMKRISVDIGGTFTDCLVAWDGDYVQAKALTTHHNLSDGFNEALDRACTALALDRTSVLSDVDSVRYATTLGTNALIERSGPRIGALVTAGFEATIPLSRGRGYGEGLDELGRNDLSSGTRPVPLVPQRLIRSVRERIDYAGAAVLDLDEDDVRAALRALVDAGAEAIVVVLTNAVENPVHERRVQEIFLEEYPAHQLGAIPILLSHQMSGRKGEDVRATSTIIDAFLHSTMHYG